MLSSECGFRQQFVRSFVRSILSFNYINWIIRIAFIQELSGIWARARARVYVSVFCLCWARGFHATEKFVKIRNERQTICINFWSLWHKNRRIFTCALQIKIPYIQVPCKAEVQEQGVESRYGEGAEGAEGAEGGRGRPKWNWNPHTVCVRCSAFCISSDIVLFISSVLFHYFNVIVIVCSGTRVSRAHTCESWSRTH